MHSVCCDLFHKLAVAFRSWKENCYQKIVGVNFKKFGWWKHLMALNFISLIFSSDLFRLKASFQSLLFIWRCLYFASGHIDCTLTWRNLWRTFQIEIKVLQTILFLFSTLVCLLKFKANIEWSLWRVDSRDGFHVSDMNWSGKSLDNNWKKEQNLRQAHECASTCLIALQAYSINSNRA